MTQACIFLFSAISSEGITDFLGAAALGAFVLTALWVLVIVALESARAKRSQASRTSSSAYRHAREKEERRQKEFSAEIKRIEEEYAEFYEETMKVARTKLLDLTSHARSALGRIAASYSRNCRNYEREHSDAIKERFQRTCDHQWHFFKSDLGYISFKDVEPHLRSVLECQDAFDGLVSERAGAEAVSEAATPDRERARDLLELKLSIPSEKLGMLQMETLQSITPFSSYYDKYVKEWLNDILFGIVNKLRKKGAFGASIRDTELKQRFVRLKHALETMGRLSDRLESNLQEKGEQRAAFAQIVFAGVALDMLASAPEWFPDLGDPGGAAAEYESGEMDEGQSSEAQAAQRQAV